MPSLRRDDDAVFVLDLGADENRFNPHWVGEVDGLLDEVEAADGPRALVTTSSGKFWSNGLDLEWMAENGEAINPFIADVHALFARMLTLPLPTVAALGGHAFAAGAMLAIAHDFRVMRADRGYFCFPEVDIQIPFTPGMSALIQSRLSKRTAHESMTTGRRYGGGDALSAGIVDAVAGEDKVLDTAIDLARPLAGKPSATLGAIKSRMYGDTVAILRDVEANGVATL
jgi:enoyl-CoA hydratase/carnithine racemase